MGTVTSVYTDLAIIDITSDGMEVRELVAGITFADLQNVTDAALTVSAHCQTHENVAKA